MPKWSQDKADSVGGTLVPVLLLAIFLVISVPADTSVAGVSSWGQFVCLMADTGSELSIELHEASFDLAMALNRVYLVAKAVLQILGFFFGLTV